jgi:hypothetical protein
MKAERLDTRSDRDVVASATVYGPPCGLAWGAIVVTLDEVLIGATLMACGDCVGSGVYLLPDESIVACNTCKRAGRVGVNC